MLHHDAGETKDSESIRQGNNVNWSWIQPAVDESLGVALPLTGFSSGKTRENPMVSENASGMALSKNNVHNLTYYPPPQRQSIAVSNYALPLHLTPMPYWNTTRMPTKPTPFAHPSDVIKLNANTNVFIPHEHRRHASPPASTFSHSLKKPISTAIVQTQDVVQTNHYVHSHSTNSTPVINDSQINKVEVHSGKKASSETTPYAPSSNSSSDQFRILKKRFLCTWKGCGKSFSTSGHASRHERIHLNLKSYPCPYPGCQIAFIRPDSLKRHLSKHHDPNSRSAKDYRKKNKNATLPDILIGNNDLLSSLPTDFSSTLKNIVDLSTTIPYSSLPCSNTMPTHPTLSEDQLDTLLKSATQSQSHTAGSSSRKKSSGGSRRRKNQEASKTSTEAPTATSIPPSEVFPIASQIEDDWVFDRFENTTNLHGESQDDMFQLEFDF